MEVERSLCIALMMLAALGGCATSPSYEESAYKGTKATGRQTRPSSQPVVDDEGRCRDYGFLPGTVDYARCRELMRQVRAKPRLATVEEAPDL